MNLMLSKNYKIYAYAVAFWVVMFAISAVFIDPATGDPWLNAYFFHAILFVVSLAILYPLFRYFKRKGWNDAAAYISFVLVNIVLDLAILVPFIGVPFTEWASFILPAYLLGAGIVYKLTKS